jgi:1,4-dihydroxy-6-naphthoate synthase
MSEDTQAAGRAPRRIVRIGHSPDPDDAFMFYGLASGQVPTGDYAIEQVLDDIESLNRLAMRGEIEVTAVSIHAYAYLSDRYLLLPCGASMGDGYGPIVVARRPMELEELKTMTIVVPGRLTSASLALRLALGDVAMEVMPFDAILPAVARGQREVGLLIHEGQLTYGASGVVKVLDLGDWWMRDTGLPLPLGGNAIRRDLGERAIAEIGAIFKKSIEFGLNNRREALTYAMDFGRGIGRPLADRFVGMYVNDYTLDYGARGRHAIEAFLARGHLSGVVPHRPAVEFAALRP